MNEYLESIPDVAFGNSGVYVPYFKTWDIHDLYEAKVGKSANG